MQKLCRCLNSPYTMLANDPTLDTFLLSFILHTDSFARISIKNYKMELWKSKKKFLKDDRWQQKDNKMQIGKFINLYGSIWLRLIHIFLSSFVFQNVHHRFKASQR